MNEKYKDIPKEELLECYNVIDSFLKFLDEQVALEAASEGEEK